VTPQVENVLNRLHGVRSTGNGWVGRCPAHRDRAPSLSIREDNGKVLLHCFAACTVEEVCAAMGIGLSELFSGARGPHKHASPIVRAMERQLAATGLRSRLTPRARRLPVTIVVANRATLEAAIARALALTVEGQLAQVLLKEGAE
jgi:CHC2 zinc finger